MVLTFYLVTEGYLLRLTILRIKNSSTLGNNIEFLYWVLFFSGASNNTFSLLYSFLIWIFYNSIFIYVVWFHYLRTNSVFSPMIHIGMEVNFSFLVFTFANNQPFTQALNHIDMLTKRIKHLDFKLSELSYPFIPTMIIVTKIYYDYNAVVGMPMFTVSNVICVLIKTTLDVLLHTTLLCIEKIIRKINRQIQNNSLHLSVKQLQPLMIYFFDVQEFIFSLSNSVGFSYMVLIVNTMVLNMFYMNKNLSSIIASLRYFNADSMRSVIHVVEWQFRVYTFLLICYRSQRINEEVSAGIQDVEGDF